MNPTRTELLDEITTKITGLISTSSVPLSDQEIIDCANGLLDVMETFDPEKYKVKQINRLGYSLD